jgi:hypothetical protein
MKNLLGIAGLSLVLVFANASIRGGMLETTQARGHAIDGLKTAFGLPYGQVTSQNPIRFHGEALQCRKLVMSSFQMPALQMTIAPPEPPAPPMPPQPIDVALKVAEHSESATSPANNESACF